MYLNRIALILLTSMFLSGCKLYQQIQLSKAQEKQYITQSNYAFSIPFELVNNYMIVKVTIEGQVYDFLFDTGAPLCSDATLAANIKKDFVTKKELVDAQGMAKTLAIYTLPVLQLSEMNWFKAPFYTFDFSHGNKGSGLKVAGVFGASLMKDAIWQIDYKQQKITLTDQIDSLKINEHVKAFAFRKNTTKTPCLDITLGTEQATILVDTGSPFGISLQTASFPILQAANEPHIRTDTRLFGEKIDSSYQIQKRNITLNKHHTFEQVAIKLSSALSSSLMGNEFLNDYKVTIDWFYDTIYFEAYE